MKKSAIILSVLSVVFFSSLALAEEMDPNMDMGQQDEQQGGAHDHSGGAGGEKKMGMMGMMGKGGMMHEQPKIVATSDGGIVVLQGPKLIKYDAQLNLVKEVEMKGGPNPRKDRDKAAAKSDDSGPQPMTDSEISAMLNEGTPTEPKGDFAKPEAAADKGTGSGQ